MGHRDAVPSKTLALNVSFAVRPGSLRGLLVQDRGEAVLGIVQMGGDLVLDAGLKGSVRPGQISDLDQQPLPQPRLPVHGRNSVQSGIVGSSRISASLSPLGYSKRS